MTNRRQLVQWLGHRATWIYVATTVLLITVDVLTWASSGMTSPASVAAAALLVVASLGLMTAGTLHDLTLCEACLSEVPMSPEDQLVQRRRWVFPVYHRTGFKIAATAGWAVAVAVAITTGAHPLLFDAWLAALAIFTYVRLIHQRLDLWCPYCRGDGGPGDEGAPDPVPDPVRSGAL